MPAGGSSQVAGQDVELLPRGDRSIARESNSVAYESRDHVQTYMEYLLAGTFPVSQGEVDTVATEMTCAAPPPGAARRRTFPGRPRRRDQQTRAVLVRDDQHVAGIGWADVAEREVPGILEDEARIGGPIDDSAEDAPHVVQGSDRPVATGSPSRSLTSRGVGPRSSVTCSPIRHGGRRRDVASGLSGCYAGGAHG